MVRRLKNPLDSEMLVSPGDMMVVVQEFDVRTDPIALTSKGYGEHSVITALEGDLVEYIGPLVQKTHRGKKMYRFKLYRDKQTYEFIAQEGYIDKVVDLIE